MILDSTVGGISANSYADVDYADAFFGGRVYSGLWVLTAQKEKALINATRLLDDYMNWAGYQATREQALRWPRGSVLDQNNYFYLSSVIPEKVKQATCELAYFILAEDRTVEDDLKGLSSIAIGSLRIEADKNDKKMVLPDAVVDMLRGLGVSYHNTLFVELNRG